MTEYNEGARGRARYWMERAQRAEAECERLRDALECLVAEQNDAPLERHREEWERAMRKAQEALDAPHTPEQTTHKWEPPSVLSEIWPDIEDDEPQQAHGDALAALDRTQYRRWKDRGGARGYVCGDVPVALLVQVIEDYRRLTASGVPYVPEEVRRLPERMRSAAKEMQAKEPRPGSRLSGRIDEAWVWADELESALASAPADGWPDRFYEVVGWTLAECCAALDRGEDPRQMEAPAVLERCKRDLSRDAAAPSDGGSDENAE